MRDLFRIEAESGWAFPPAERPCGPHEPVVCLDEKPLTLHADVRPAAAAPGREASFTWDTEGGVRESVIEIKQEGEKLSATMGDAQLTGRAGAGGFEHSGKLYSPQAGYTAYLDAGRLVGSSDWEAHRSTFTAVRAD